MQRHCRIKMQEVLARIYTGIRSTGACAHNGSSQQQAQSPVYFRLYGMRIFLHLEAAILRPIVTHFYKVPVHIGGENKELRITNNELRSCEQTIRYLSTYNSVIIIL